jgi:DNA-binding transcriptional LysR family regulator
MDVLHSIHAPEAWMDLVLVESLLAVAEHGSVTRASRALALTQPALTRRLQQLEDAMGAPLLLRSKRGAVLTEAGRVVVAEGRQLIERWQRMRESVRAHQSLETGLVRLGGGATAVSFLVPSTIAEFGRLYPGVRFEVREEGSRAVEDDVSSERLELGIVTLPTRSRDFDVRPLRRDRIVLVAGAAHPLSRKRRVDVRVLQGQGLVGFESDSAIRRLIDEALRTAGVTMNVQMELRSIAAIIEMVAHTSLLAFVSHLGVQGRERELGVRIVEVRGLSIDRRLAVISKTGRALSPAARAFAALLR